MPKPPINISTGANNRPVEDPGEGTSTSQSSSAGPSPFNRGDILRRPVVRQRLLDRNGGNLRHNLGSLERANINRASSEPRLYDLQPRQAENDRVTLDRAASLPNLNAEVNLEIDFDISSSGPAPDDNEGDSRTRMLLEVQRGSSRYSNDTKAIVHGVGVVVGSMLCLAFGPLGFAISALYINTAMMYMYGGQKFMLDSPQSEPPPKNDEKQKLQAEKESLDDNPDIALDDTADTSSNRESVDEELPPAPPKKVNVLIEPPPRGVLLNPENDEIDGVRDTSVADIPQDLLEDRGLVVDDLGGPQTPATQVKFKSGVVLTIIPDSRVDDSTAPGVLDAYRQPLLSPLSSLIIPPAPIQAKKWPTVQPAQRLVTTESGGSARDHFWRGSTSSTGSSDSRTTMNAPLRGNITSSAQMLRTPSTSLQRATAQFVMQIPEYAGSVGEPALVNAARETTASLQDVVSSVINAPPLGDATGMANAHAARSAMVLSQRTRPSWPVFFSQPIVTTESSASARDGHWRNQEAVAQEDTQYRAQVAAEAAARITASRTDYRRNFPASGASSPIVKWESVNGIWQKKN